MLKEEEIVEAERGMSIAQRLAFMDLPLEERRRILAEQAEHATRD